MRKEAEELLRLFQCDQNRMLEEDFARTLSENEQVRLFFINEDQAFTDGRNIIVDPAVHHLFDDDTALQNTTDFLGWQPQILADRWMALRLLTRAQTIHECLHILYSDFSPPATNDPKCDSKIKRQVMGHISNIIEDAYIEAVGSSVYDQIEIYLRFGRVSRLFATTPTAGTAERSFGVDLDERMSENRQVTDSDEAKALEIRRKKWLLVTYLDYMCGFLLYPMIRQTDPEPELISYVEQTKDLFAEGSMAASPAERYTYVERIFDLILPLIPDTEEDLEDEQLTRRLGGTKTHSVNTTTIGAAQSEGRTQAVSRRLFTEADGRLRGERNDREQLAGIIASFAKEKEETLKIILYTGKTMVFHGRDFDCSVMHKEIQINEIHPKIDLNLRRAYQNIYGQYRININSYTNRFVQLLKAKTEVREEKYQFGVGIASKMLGDPQKRYWYRNIPGAELPDMALLLLIDGSGSMHGERCRGAMISAVILHEVLKKQGLPHAIIEHRAMFEDPEIEVNILVDFDGREEEKYNLMRITSGGDNRDGLALYWAERYLNQRTANEYKLMIVLSDGAPAHEFDDYYPPVSIKDTANAVRKIMKRGTDIIAIALDDEDDYDCYEQLKEIYPNLIGCNDLSRLTRQLLGVISRLL
ncbi:MAG: hypothetical protein Q4D52_01935 [Eubacteriales bacterium]|nr:hypothetical protein [Eubacteriales bacterium]